MFNRFYLPIFLAIVFYTMNGMDLQSSVIGGISQASKVRVDDWTRDHGITPLHKAVEHNDIGLVEHLIKCGANVNEKDMWAASPLHRAIEQNRVNFDLICLLLAAPHCDLNIEDQVKKTPLHRAVAWGHGAVVKKLLSYEKTDVNALDNWEQTPLHCAVESCRPEAREILKMLVHDQRINPNLQDYRKHTPLYLAAKAHDLDRMSALFQRTDIDVNIQGAEWGDCTEDFFTTPLHLAIENGHLEIVFALLARADTNVNTQCINGCTPLYSAVQKAYFNVVLALFKRPEINVNLRATTYECYAPLHLAAIINDVEILREFLKRNDTNVNIQDSYGNSPLNLALKREKQAHVLELLKRSDIDTYLPNKNGCIPLTLAEKLGWHDVAKMIRESAIKKYLALACAQNSRLGKNSVVRVLKKDCWRLIFNCMAQSEFTGINGSAKSRIKQKHEAIST